MNTEEQINYVQDTPFEVIRNYPNMKVSGLYYIDDDGDKIQVANHSNIYFGSDMRWRYENGVHGLAYVYTRCALYPVYLPDGSRFRNADLCSVSARYKDGVIYDYGR